MPTTPITCLLCASTFLQIASCAFTFKNVMVTCDSDSALSDEEITFSTVVTTNRLKPHLPLGQQCNNIAIQHSTIPTLTRDSLSDINNANFLVLESDEIEAIEPGALRNVVVKQAISLKMNKLREIRRGVFEGVRVPVLFLSFNAISYVDYQAFDNMTDLEIVHLDHNRIASVNPFWFKNAPKVTKVNLSHNNIHRVDANAFANHVSKIDLSNNIIQSVDPHAFRRTKKLLFLGLAHNLIHDLDPNWLKDVKVHTLDLSSNSLYCLEGGLGGLQSTNFLDKNPWDCSCLERIKRKENRVFGTIVANEDFNRCNIS
ncbi:leucine-rich repeat-containing protein let-4 [Tribolium castaneum]|uniref:Chaoptin-like Protein n=1 Tax=Tribolium castaneum TaxID=7070 RepID=D7EI96_TRICA|nr:PREDICTED: leucine-rich repeat-containing protein let-4 [Tribolium castaneum]EFA11750.1 Chaoptin-like Protein [Tribolium castaneum]|eukprot:XP_008198825.1 PREDICTED: leucine-rich repeat-containing protein let-4 [Tribolium castaneum]